MEWYEERQTFSKMSHMCRILRSNHNKWVGSIKGRNFLNSRDYRPIKKDSTHVVVQRILNDGQTTFKITVTRISESGEYLSITTANL